MNIIVFSEAAWDDKNSFGNTVSNLFCGDVWGNDKFLNFYVRNQLPDNNMKNIEYYQLSAIDILKGLIEFKICGNHFDSINEITADINVRSKQEQQRIEKIHGSKNELIYYGHEMIWRTGIWINKYFDAFIDTNKPDILFAFATSPYILCPLVRYLRKKTNCKIVLLVADNVYQGYEKNKWYRRSYLKKTLRECILLADRVYGISDEMSQLYYELFGKDVTTLYKGCDLSVTPKIQCNNPLKIVYAGNLFWGRDDILEKIAETLEDINENNMTAKLEIYTGAVITPQLEKKLNKGNSSHIMGPKSYCEIKQIMHDADIVLHVESFNENTIDTVRYSFSTKIIDCLQSGSQILGIGPKGIASIEYLKKVNGAIVIDSKEKIADEMKKLLETSNLIPQRVYKTRKYAMEKHDINRVQESLRYDFESMM